ncbi:MAG: hypothetical protein R3362_06395 [Rhodothermales bacterium]|nr:hypothetical protein [Rhodothermales bacterium]
MLQLALAALLLAFPLADGDDEKDKDKVRQDAPEAVADDNIINDTYSFGPSEPFPIKLWVGYAWGNDEDAYLSDGTKVSEAGAEFGSVTAQRAVVGAQLNVINFPRFAVGVGGQLVAAKTEFENIGVTIDTPGGPTTLRATGESDFKLQNAKVYGVLKGRVLGIHGGYIFDLEDEDVAVFDQTGQNTGEVPVSDQVDAWFVGVDFDYPGELIRIFAGVDYFNRDFEEATPGGIEDDEIVVFNGGGGIRIAFVELGAALITRTNLDRNRFTPSSANPGDGGFQASIAPYLNLSPRQLPFSLAVKGAVLGEYADYGYSFGGNDDIVSREGFTVTATLGF